MERKNNRMRNTLNLRIKHDQGIKQVVVVFDYSISDIHMTMNWRKTVSGENRKYDSSPKRGIEGIYYFLRHYRQQEKLCPEKER
jgi:hypothetical protein